MITVFFYCTIHPGREEAMRELVREMTRVSREEDRAIHYIFHQQRKQPTEWALYEQWRDKDALKAHQANMMRHFGEPPAGAQLPARLHALCSGFHGVYYDVVE